MLGGLHPIPKNEFDIDLTIGYMYFILAPELFNYLLKNCHHCILLTLRFQEKEKHIICLTRKLYAWKMFWLIIYVNPTSVC